ncbi:HIT domain-containing protein [Idiomarina xiamenensis]|uniref:Histidine triad (HIT) protein n=1 Tax=Idiomarina xiamenensis 10-D-4 TaxID=740709 RepID=K2JK59_9GAMM|nr:HIT family protein [Idiomarina xiamenensis]EKE83846.1 histidine triad (HIT) protein [Idiomarina xiamenensis 10-D-4]
MQHPDQFELDDRLANDSWYLVDWRLCQLRLMNDQRYPWLLLIPRLQGCEEISTLTDAQQQQLWREVNDASKCLQQHQRLLLGESAVSPAKVNIAALGNMVRQLHLHVVLRHPGDPAWPGPVWGHSAAQPYLQPEQQVAAWQQRLAAAVG